MSIIAFYAFEVFVVLFEMFNISRLMSALPQRNRPISRALVYIVFFVALAGASMSHASPYILLMLSLAGIFIVALFGYGGSISDKVFLAFAYIAFVLISELVCYQIFSSVLSGDMAEIHEVEAARIITTLVVKLAQLFFVSVVAIVKKHSFKTSWHKIHEMVPLLICQLIIIFLALLIYMISGERQPTAETEVILSSIALMVLDIVLFWYYESIIAAGAYKQQKLAAEIQFENQVQYYTSLGEYQNKIEAMRHDMQKHLRFMKEMIDNGHTDESMRLLGEISAEFSQKQTVIYTPHPVVSAIISSALTRAEEMNIQVTLDIRVPPILNVAHIDLSILIGNIMDNALEECELLTEGTARYLDFTLVEKKSKILIKAINPRAPKPQKKKGIHHGLGLKNIQSVAEKYSGIVSIDEQEAAFSISVILFSE